MKTSVVIFSCFCALILLVSVIPETEGFGELLELFDDKKMKKKILKKLVYYYVAVGNKKIYAVPFPLPLPIPILKKLQPIIYKEETKVPVPYEMPSYHQQSYGGGNEYY